MLSVRRTRAQPVAQNIAGRPTVTSMYRENEDRRNLDLEVRTFATEPAYVRVSSGMTQNMGNYESLRVDVAVTLPCYVEEIDDALVVAADKVSLFLEEEMGRYNDAR